MYNGLKCILANLFRVFVLQKFVRVFFGNKKVDKKIRWFVYSLFYFINTGVYLMLHRPLFNVLSSILGILCITLLYTREYKKVIFTVASVYLVDLVCNVVVTLEFLSYIAGETFDENQEVLTVLLLFICELIVEKIIKNREAADDLHKVPVILMPICSLIILGLLLSDSFSMREKEIIVSTGLLLISFLFFCLYDMLVELFKDKYERDILKKRAEIYANQIEVILQSENKIKRLRHDLKHHMNEMKILAIKEDTAAIQEYIGQMEEFLQNPNEIVSSGNAKIDSLLNYMLQKAGTSLKKVTSKVQLPEQMNHSFDINIILGNLLENAIEAAEKTEEKELSAFIQLKQGVLRVEVSNSCLENFKRDEQGFITTKKEKELHGIGLSSVRKIVEKYEGLMEVHQTESHFTVQLILYISKMEGGV